MAGLWLIQVINAATGYRIDTDLAIQTVVEQYYQDISNYDYLDAWNLGGDDVGGTDYGSWWPDMPLPPALISVRLVIPTPARWT
ncbi:MAG TPA: hypothetical protein VLW50_03800 [Streptosporangiaceae bacterium]|nr:hypothetical protein [Streptosporangiaceae bacterium]